MNREEAHSFFQSSQRMTTLWTGVIAKHVVFIIVLIAAFWSYFLKAYIESVAINSAQGFSYLAVAAGLTSILLGLWRVYSRYIYNSLAGLYPDLLHCEKILGIEPYRGTGGELQKCIPRLRRILGDNELNPDQKQEAISFLVETKRLGQRSHLVIDFIIIVIIITMFVLCISVHAKIQLPLAIGTIMATIGGFLLVLCGIFTFQRYPSQSTIATTITKYQEE